MSLLSTLRRGVRPGALLAVLACALVAAVMAPSSASASAYGIQYWTKFNVSIGGQTIGVPAGQLAHQVNGGGDNITSEWAHITTAPGFCNWRVDYVYRDANNGEEYRRIRGTTHNGCDTWAYAETVYPGKVRYGTACAELYRSGAFVTRQCHSITR